MSYELPAQTAGTVFTGFLKILHAQRPGLRFNPFVFKIPQLCLAKALRTSANKKLCYSQYRRPAHYLVLLDLHPT